MSVPEILKAYSREDLADIYCNLILEHWDSRLGEKPLLQAEEYKSSDNIICKIMWACFGYIEDKLGDNHEYEIAKYYNVTREKCIPPKEFDEWWNKKRAEETARCLYYLG